ncbi:MAG: SpoIIE family protein phosphatase, partial [Lachnospiraceae bacterium]
LSLDSLASAFLIHGQKKGEQEDRQTLLWEKRMEENCQLFSGHLKEMAEMIKNTTKESVRIIRLGKRKEKQIGRMLYLEGLVLDDFYLLEKGNGKREAVVSLHLAHSMKKSGVCSAEEVAGFLSVLLETKLISTGRPPFFVTRDVQTMYFQEESRFMVLTGFARAVKEKERISGDNHSFFEASEGEFYALLSDGMGSGSKACADSELVLNMAEKFLSSGFSEELAMQLINDALIMGGENKNMSTMDLCRINLYTGEADFLKIGAASSLIRRDGYVEELPANSLPLGVFAGVEPCRIRRRLLDGDYVFLFSDGVTDSFHTAQGQEFLKQLVAEIPYRQPREMAGYLMKYVIQAAQGRIRDDMTVLVIGIWDNGGEEIKGNH